MVTVQIAHESLSVNAESELDYDNHITSNKAENSEYY